MAQRPRRAVVSLAIAIVGALSACSGRGCRSSSEEQADEPVKPKPRKKATVADCERYAQTFCELYLRCDARNYVWAYDDAKRCREATAAYCAYELRAPGSGDTPKAINECAEAFAKTTCDEWATRATAPVCHPPGTRKVGESCEVAAQCESYFCKTDKATDRCGKCAKLPGEGDPCPDYRCQVGFLCTGGKCQKPKKEGDPCGTDYECGALVCFKEKRWAALGVCKKPLAVGDACRDPYAWDDEEFDDEGLYGVGSIGTLGSLGGVDAGASDAKADAAADAGDADADAGKSKPQSDCDRRAFDTCVAGKCTAEKRASPGDACTTATLCRGGSCESGKCVLFRAPGEKCDGSSTTKQCRFPGQCVDGRCTILDGFECDAKPKGATSSLLPFP
jgi:hypothetical protein